MQSDIYETITQVLRNDAYRGFRIGQLREIELSSLPHNDLDEFVCFLATLSAKEQYILLTHELFTHGTILLNLRRVDQIEKLSNVICAWPDDMRFRALTQADGGGKTVFHYWNECVNQTKHAESDFSVQLFKKLTVGFSDEEATKLLRWKNPFTNRSAWNGQQLDRLATYLRNKELAAIHAETLKLIISLNTDRLNLILPHDIQIKIVEQVVLHAYHRRSIAAVSPVNPVKLHLPVSPFANFNLVSPPSPLETAGSLTTQEAIQLVKNVSSATLQSIDTIYARKLRTAENSARLSVIEESTGSTLKP